MKSKISNESFHSTIYDRTVEYKSTKTSYAGGLYKSFDGRKAKYYMENQ